MNPGELAAGIARCPLRLRNRRRVVWCRDVAAALGRSGDRETLAVSLCAKDEGLKIMTRRHTSWPAAILADLALDRFLALHGQQAPGSFDPYFETGLALGVAGLDRDSYHAACLRLAGRAAERTGLPRDVAEAVRALIGACVWSCSAAAGVLNAQILEGLQALAEGTAGRMLARPSRPANVTDIKAGCPLRLVKQAKGDAA